MKGTLLQQRPVSPRTRQQQQSRLWSMLLLLCLLGPLTVLSGVILCGLARAVRKPRAFAWLALAGVVGLALLGWHWQTLIGEFVAVRDAARLFGAVLRPAPNHPVSLRQFTQAFTALWPSVWLLWRQSLLLAPMVASYIHTSKVKTAEDLERERAARQERAERAGIQHAATQSTKAPASAGGHLVLGVPISGDLGWEHGGWFTYPASILGRHLVLIGGSGSGKTETCKRLAAGAAQVYGWKVFYLDCKGDDETADAFVAAMGIVGRTRLARFPIDAYDGWHGDATALLNRLMMILDFSEPYYRDLTRMLLSLALEAPSGPPRSSAELLGRLNLDDLAARYTGMPEARELNGLRMTDAQAVYNRYRAFFKALSGGLDGAWAFEDVDAGYILLRGLELKDQTASLGRYILEDFAHYIATRKPKDERVLLIVDEFPAIAFGGANAASLFEMVRFHGAGIVVTAQSYAGMGSEVDRILGAAAGLILHQCADPERLLARAGQSLAFQRRISFTERGMGAAVKEYAIGEGMLAEAAALKIDPNAVKQLGPGECVVITGGRAEHIMVSRIGRPSQASAPTIAADAIQEIDRLGRRTRCRSETRTTATAELPSTASPSAPTVRSPTEDSIHEYE